MGRKSKYYYDYDRNKEIINKPKSKMNKAILILNLIVKTIVEVSIVVCIISLFGLIVFIATYIYKTIEKAIDEYDALIHNL